MKSLLNVDDAMKFCLQENFYSKILSRDDNNNEIRCLATNSLFDKINAALGGPNDGYSDVKIFSVFCKLSV